MELTFNEQNRRWVTEFSVTSDFNLHIESPGGGRLKVYQRTSEDGRYAEVGGVINSVPVFDCDFTALVYPKYIKVVSEVEPTLAVVTCPDGEVTEIKQLSKFTVEGQEFMFEEGMTWTSWVNSEYNTVWAFMNEAFLRFDRPSLMGYLADKDGNHIAAMYESPIADYAYTLNSRSPYSL